MQLTRNQKLMLDIEKIVGGSINVICGSVFYSKKLDMQKMAEAANELFRINDALRIRLVQNGSTVSQQITEFEKSDIEIIPVADKTQAHKYAEKQARIPFDMNKALCEIKLMEGEDFCFILYKLHHIIADAWTLSLIATQFNQIMSSQHTEAFSYADRVEADSKYLSSKRYLKDRDFYIQQFSANSEPVLFSEKNSETLSAARKTFTFSEDYVKSIQLFSKNNSISAALFFLSVISVLFSKSHNNCEQFYLGLPVVNRTGPIEKNTAGLFINTAPVSIKINSKSSFIKAAEDVEEAMMSTMRHQKYTYEDILSSLSSEFGFKGSLFDFIFSYQNAQIAGDDFESTWYHNGRQKESLQIHIDDRDDKGILKVHYDYQTEKFTEKDIENLHSHLCNLISDVLEGPEKEICELDMLSPEEKQKLLCDFNNTDVVYDEDETLYSLFEKTAKENKDKVCVRTAEKNLNFAELANISAALDCKLRNITGNKKSVVAVIAERSAEMYGAIYGIIRGGNAYLPIDPVYPQERIDFILENSNAAAVVAQDKFIGLAVNVPCVNMTELINSSEEKVTDAPESSAAPDDTAYVIYTSGSTGNPKGAKVSHKSAVNRILWMHDKYPLRQDDVILQKTPYTFDVSVWELFWWGISAGSLAASKPGEHFLPAKIIDEVYRNKITHLHFVPSVFELFLNYLETHKAEVMKFESVRYVFLSGEALTAGLVQRFYKLYDHKKVTLHNLYGPTECAVDVTYYDCLPSDADPVPIGKPIYNTQIHIVDKYLNPVPIGVTGELCIAGYNVGQGYLNNHELTAERFVDNPFGESKLYKTGDLAYWREDGNIIFIGRIDGQIKLNGQRIETGEIESVITGLSEVDAAAVIMQKTSSADMLVAFYTGEIGIEKKIRALCLNKLPKYMVPGAFVHLESLPLNQSGKLDRKALATKNIEINQSDISETPENDLERFICQSFKTILNTENVGRNSDFFDLGGTSLSMISMLSEKGFENITSAEFMRNPTPAELAALMQKNKANKTEYLETLYASDKAKQAMVVIPFAGGGAEAYSSFINCLKKKDDSMSVYFIRFLHSVKECEKAADEIAKMLADKQIIIYSHCVGSAVALQILQFLETKNITVKHYFAGAGIPPAKPTNNNIWNIVPDKVIKVILSKAGADFSGLSDGKLADLLKVFRKDTDFANMSFASLSGKIKTPMSVIMSKKDLFTMHYRQAEKIWGNYAEKVSEIRFIASQSHYFQKENSEELIGILLELID